jgi:hypothetical protein
MAKMPMDPQISPRVELCHQEPKAFLVRDEEWTCPECLDHYGLDVDGSERACVSCMIKRSGKERIMLFGWTVMRATNQIVALPPQKVMG